MISRIAIALCVLVLIACGCASSDRTPRATTTQPSQHAECLVCKKNIDLACVDVTVAKDTPKYDYNGKTYYFCSDDCRNAFIKQPQKYVAK